MKLSVIMSILNGERYLASAVESILGQTFKDFEFFIIDDGSSDGSREMLQAYAKKDDRIRLRVHEKNQGLTACLNEALAEARGEYVARMDADDVSLPERFEKQVVWLDAHPACGVLGTSYRLMDEQSGTLLNCHLTNDPDFLRWCLCFQNPLAHPSIMGRTELFRSLGGYRAEMRYAEDYDLWWRLVKVSEMNCLTEVLTCLRRHANSVSEVHKQEQLRAKWRILAEMLPQIGGEHLLPLIAGENVRPGRLEYIKGVLACFEKMPCLSETAKQLLREDAAVRLGIVAMRHPLTQTEGFFDAVKLSPALPLKAVGYGMRRLVTKTAFNPILKGN